MVCFYINKQVKTIMELNNKTSMKMLGTILILGIIGTVHSSVIEPGATSLTGFVGMMGSTLLWSE